MKSFLLVCLTLVLFLAKVSSQENDQYVAPELKYSSQFAQYPSGEAGFFKIVAGKVRYQKFPRSRQQDTISIVMQFTVLKDGRISNILFYSGDQRIEQPVRKALLVSGDWVAASQGGRYVNSYRKVKFHFRFDHINKEWEYDRNESRYLIL